MSKRKTGELSAYWRGATWTITRPRNQAEREALGDANGVLLSDKRVVLVAVDLDDDATRATVLHEVLHEVYPKMTEEQVRLGERDIKHFLEAFGVDLSPIGEI